MSRKRQAKRDEPAWAAEAPLYLDEPERSRIPASVRMAADRAERPPRRRVDPAAVKAAADRAEESSALRRRLFTR